jgi:2-polyprenyl-6-methoxyphenol hydroxylase-like FAD-dependent oxidoreductase
LQARVSLFMQKKMRETCDVAVIGGAFSGAATSLLLRREAPGLRVVVIERSTQFDRKVGEATTEVSGCFLTKRLALTHHLCHHHVVENGLRFWFSRGSEDDFDRCGELGAFYQVRLPSYQVNREVLDEHVLSLAKEAGADVRRPATDAVYRRINRPFWETRNR